MVVTRLRSSTRKVLGAHEGGVTPHGRDLRRTGERDTAGAVTIPPATVTIRPASAMARSCSWEASSTVPPSADRRHEPARRAGRDARRRGRRAARRAATARGRGPPAQPAPPAAAARPTGTRRAWTASRPSSPSRARAGSTAGERRAGGPDGEADVLGRGQIVVEGGGVAEQARPAAGRPRVGDQVGAEDRSPRRLTTRSRPAQARSRLVLPAPLAPWSRTISPEATSRSTPASTGKRPTRATAERKRMTGSMTPPKR